MRKLPSFIPAAVLFLSVNCFAQLASTGNTSFSSCDNKVIPYSAFAKLESPKFSLDISANDHGRLRYFGVTHSTDPGDPQFADIEKEWNRVKPGAAYYEGPNRPIAATKEETIQQAGESGFVRFLANRDGIPAVSLEPNPQDEVNFILKKFTPTQTKLFFVLREAARLRDRRGLAGPDLKNAVAQLLTRADKMFPAFAGIISNVDELGAAYAQNWSSPQQWWEAPSEWFDPLSTSEKTGGKFMNEINQESSHFRDLNMYRLLANATREGKVVFAAVGRNHIPMQEPALRCALEK